MTKEEYSNYLQSDTWRIFRDYILKLEECGSVTHIMINGIKTEIKCRNKTWCCESCHCITKRPQLHHLTYDCIGSERREDVMILCNRCHKNKHDKTI